MTSLPKIYVFCRNINCKNQFEDHVFSALSEDGELLTSHICSSHSFARRDMGVDENGWNREKYAKAYPNGFEVELIEGDPHQHPGFVSAYDKNLVPVIERPR